MGCRNCVDTLELNPFLLVWELSLLSLLDISSSRKLFLFFVASINGWVILSCQSLWGFSVCWRNMLILLYRLYNIWTRLVCDSIRLILGYYMRSTWVCYHNLQAMDMHCIACIANCFFPPFFARSNRGKFECKAGKLACFTGWAAGWPGWALLAGCLPARTRAAGSLGYAWLAGGLAAAWWVDRGGGRARQPGRQLTSTACWLPVRSSLSNLATSYACSRPPAPCLRSPRSAIAS